MFDTRSRCAYLMLTICCSQNDNITVAQVGNSEHQHENLLDLMPSLMSGEFRLLVIDSIVNLFRIDYHGGPSIVFVSVELPLTLVPAGRGELSERQHALNQHLSRIRKISEVSPASRL